MTRVLVIDGNRTLTEAVAVQCLEHGIAVRLADTFCEGVRHLLETPVSLAASRSGADGAACAIVSTVTATGPDEATFPAASLAVAV